jgi:hypothetical protein
MPVQNHIHLAKTLGNAPEFAPDTTWIAYEALPIPTVIASSNITLGGVLKKHRLRRGGEVVRFRDMRYRLKVTEYGGLTAAARLSLLEQMQGEEVYLVEHDHPNNGQDHAPAVRKMYLENVNPFEHVTTGLTYFTVEISLKDDKYR